MLKSRNGACFSAGTKLSGLSLIQKVPDPRPAVEKRVYKCLLGLGSVLAGTDRPTLT